SGEYLFSADTVDRIPAFYARVKDLPYRPGPAKELADPYSAVAGNKTATVYEMFSNSPVGLDRIVPTRWMLNLPEWTKSRLFGLAIWQWLGMTLGFLIAALLIF